VLGWGGSFADDYDAISNYIDRAEKSKVQMFDRWGVAVDTTAVLPPLPSKRLSVPPQPKHEARGSPTASRRTSIGVTPDSALTSVKRVGRFLMVFFSSCGSLFAGQTQSVAGDVSVDDLTGMIEDFTHHVKDLIETSAAVTKDTAPAVATIETLLEAIQTETNLFVSSVFAEDAGDSEAETALLSLREKVEQCVAASQSIASSTGEEPASGSAAAPGTPPAKSRKFRAAGAASTPKVEAEADPEPIVIPTFTKQVSRKLAGRGRARRASEPAVRAMHVDAVLGEEKYAINNYLGIGLDAKVTRTCNPFMFGLAPPLPLATLPLVHAHARIATRARARARARARPLDHVYSDLSDGCTPSATAELARA
jgi:hypothetical protein